MKEQGKYILLTVPCIDITKTCLYLPIATLKNSGGYRIKLDANTILPSYSPIDLAVAGLTALYLREQSIYDLSKWFLTHINPISESWVACNISKIDKNNSTYDNMWTYSITEWKAICKDNSKLKTLFKKNAPFTFREI